MMRTRIHGIFLPVLSRYCPSTVHCCLQSLLNLLEHVIVWFWMQDGESTCMPLCHIDIFQFLVWSVLGEFVIQYLLGPQVPCVLQLTDRSKKMNSAMEDLTWETSSPANESHGNLLESSEDTSIMLRKHLHQCFTGDKKRVRNNFRLSHSHGCLDLGSFFAYVRYWQIMQVLSKLSLVGFEK